MKYAGLFAAAAAFLISSVAHANLISNGDFGTGDFSDWSPTGSGEKVDCVAAGCAAEFDYTADISQAFTTVAGAQYIVSFTLLGTPPTQGGNPNPIHVQTIPPLIPDANDLIVSYVDSSGPHVGFETTNFPGFSPFDFTFLATDASTTLDFSVDFNVASGQLLLNKAPTWPLFLIDISVVSFDGDPVDPQFLLYDSPYKFTTTPEPQSLALFFAGLGGLLALRRATRFRPSRSPGATMCSFVSSGTSGGRRQQ